MPHWTFIRTWARDGKIRDPPEPPRTIWIESSGFRIILAAVDDRGLGHQHDTRAGGVDGVSAEERVWGLTFCLGLDSSMDWAIDQMHRPHQVSQSHLPDQLLCSTFRVPGESHTPGLTLFVVEYHPSLIIHDVTTPNEVDCGRDRRRSAPLIQDAQMGRPVIYRRIVLESIVSGIMRCVLHYQPYSPSRR